MTTWDKIIKEAQKRGYFTDDEKNTAGAWYSCAIGEFRPRLKKVGVKFRTEYLGPQPDEDTLDEWGGAFSTAVSNNDFTDALSIYNKIKAWVTRREKKK